jgi:hypothetical protein
VRNTAKITGKGVSTVQRVKLALAKVEKPCRQAIATSAISNRLGRPPRIAWPDVKKARLVLDLQGRGWRAFALRAYRRDYINMFPFLSRDDKMGRVALPDQHTAQRRVVDQPE